MPSKWANVVVAVVAVPDVVPDDLKVVVANRVAIVLDVRVLNSSCIGDVGRRC